MIEGRQTLELFKIQYFYRYLTFGLVLLLTVVQSGIGVLEGIKHTLHVGDTQVEQSQQFLRKLGAYRNIGMLKRTVMPSSDWKKFCLS